MAERSTRFAKPSIPKGCRECLSGRNLRQICRLWNGSRQTRRVKVPLHATVLRAESSQGPRVAPDSLEDVTLPRDYIASPCVNASNEQPQLVHEPDVRWLWADCRCYTRHVRITYAVRGMLPEGHSMPTWAPIGENSCIGRGSAVRWICKRRAHELAA